MTALNWFYDPNGRKMFMASEDRFAAVLILTLPESSIVEYA